MLFRCRSCVLWHWTAMCGGAEKGYQRELICWCEEGHKNAIGSINRRWIDKLLRARSIYCRNHHHQQRIAIFSIHQYNSKTIKYGNLARHPSIYSLPINACILHYYNQMWQAFQFENCHSIELSPQTNQIQLAYQSPRVPDQQQTAFTYKYYKRKPFAKYLSPLIYSTACTCASRAQFLPFS